MSREYAKLNARKRNESRNELKNTTDSYIPEDLRSRWVGWSVSELKIRQWMTLLFAFESVQFDTFITSFTVDKVVIV